jgi:RNA polymerase sigma-70 factor (ECF subfamily)
LNIVASIKNSDEFIFEQVYQEYHEKLYYYMLSKSKSTYIAEEVVQITFIKLWNNRERLNEEFTISTHIFRIASTTFIDLLRKQSNSLKIYKELESRDTDLPNNNISEKMDESDVYQLLNKALNKMPPVRKKVFEMSRVDGMTYKEIADKMFISPKTVENHISKALQQLKKYFSILFLFFLKFFD